jgi:hypothetical protein
MTAKGTVGAPTCFTTFRHRPAQPLRINQNPRLRLLHLNADWRSSKNHGLSAPRDTALHHADLLAFSMSIFDMPI